MHRRRSWIAALAAVALIVAAGSAAAAPRAAGAVGRTAAEAACSGLVVRLAAAVRAVPGGRGAARPETDRRSPRRVTAETGCGIDPHGQPLCRPQG